MPRGDARATAVAAFAATLGAAGSALAREGEATGFQERMDQWFGTWIVEPAETIIYWRVPILDMPLVVLWLIAGAVLFTFRTRFVNLRMAGHGVGLVSGRYDDPESEGEVSHFQALASALSATVGLGNIAGVAIAVGTGGPGATFWMILAGLFGMSSKFVECTLGQQYREERPDGRILGGPMQYLSVGLAEKGWPRLGRVLAGLFVVLCIGTSLGGGNTFQVRQSLAQIQEIVPFLRDYPWVYGLVMTFLVGIVIIGGIKRIARVAGKVVPAMCVFYILSALYVLAANASEIPEAFALIFREPFSPQAAFGGFLGVFVTGIQRAAFSNEAGIGSAPIAHSAARARYPVQEGLVAMLGPFIDTVVVCTMTSLVIIITGAYANPANLGLVMSDAGAALTSRAMGNVLPWFPHLLAIAVVFFAYSTMLAWSYYGERCWTWVFGDRSSMVYRVLFLAFVFIGSMVTASNILTFSDVMLLGMGFPNVLGAVILLDRVLRALGDYRERLRSGEIRPVAERGEGD